MTSATAPAAPVLTVRKIIPGFTALFEGAVGWSACGPVANEVAVAAVERRAPSVALAKAVVARDLAAGRYAQPGGQTLSSIAWDLGKRGIQRIDVTPYSSAPDLAKLHTQVKDATFAGLPVIIEVGKAYNLPDNEAGVQYHFVVLGGIDSELGYLVANGDTRTFISTKQTLMVASQLRWATWPTLVAAGICGAITVHPNPAPAVVIAPVVATLAPATPPTPAVDYQPQIDALKSELDALKAGLKAL